MHDQDYELQDNQLAFIHIPKTGGTTVSDVLKTNFPGMVLGHHSHFALNRDYPPAKYFTFLRHPIQRVWSYYNIVAHEYTDFEHFMKVYWEVQNMACKKISGYQKTNNLTILSEAKKLIKSFFFVGIFEELNKSIKNLAYLIDPKVQIKNIPRLNCNPYKNTITKSQENLIVKYNEYDIELYEEFAKLTKLWI